jgi:hypothetical protein
LRNTFIVRRRSPKRVITPVPGSPVAFHGFVSMRGASSTFTSQNTVAAAPRSRSSNLDRTKIVSGRWFG